jgi:hypothetical protein
VERFRLVLLVAVDAPAAKGALVAYRKLQYLKVPRSMGCKRTMSSEPWRPRPCPALWSTMFHVKRAPTRTHHRKYVTDPGEREPQRAADIDAPMVILARAWGALGVTAGSTGILCSAAAVE